jgi:hypothetical protein
MSYGRPPGCFVTVRSVAPPDETLVATIATIVTFAIVMPLIVKWWPRPKPPKKSQDERAAPTSRSAPRKSPTSRAPASTTVAARAAQSNPPRTMGRRAPAAPGRTGARTPR